MKIMEVPCVQQNWFNAEHVTERRRMAAGEISKTYK